MIEPDALPAAWTGAHVGVRLSEAFRTLARLPNTGRPRGVRSALAGLPMILEEAGEVEPRRLRPSPSAISRMEEALAWPSTYLTDPELIRRVQLWAWCKGASRPVSRALRATGLRRDQLDRGRLKAVMVIARGLARNRVPVR